MTENKTGKVWLVGAGPSDPGLFTIKGREVLRQAEVVVYDALVGQSILNMIPDDAETINVGKRSSHHIMRQEKISELLVEKAREGKRVVRLKGGDPFLFGRGGEELELLAAGKIPYEVVPGVTSALSVPAYQGIPVTHRDYCSSLHIITGHKRADSDDSLDIDFEALVRTRGTLVFLMGVSSLGAICRGLIQAGMDKNMPAALLIQGTTSSQERIVATVATLEEEVLRRGARTPAIIVVGKVCSLADEFCWYEKLPLGGVKVVLTRPKDRMGETAAKLRALGAEVLELPAIRTERIQSNTLLAEALDEISEYQWVVFTSPIGVRVFFEELSDRKLDFRRLANIKFAAIGTGTSKELTSKGFYPDLIPDIYDAEHLGKALYEICEAGEKVLIPRARIGSQELIAALTGEKKLKISDIPTYDTIYESSRIIDEKMEFEKNTVDYVVFTSASTVRGFVAAVPGIDYTKLQAICIGKQTKAAADQYGMKTWMSEKATIDSLIECLIARNTYIRRNNNGYESET